MKEIQVSELNENMIERIGKEWMLVTSGDKDSFNTMTASWGGIGFIWRKPVAVTVVRDSRLTHQFIERTHRFTLAFFDGDYRKQLSTLGTKSGRDMDKMHDSGLTPYELPSGAMTFKEAWLTLECEVLYKDEIKEANFLDKSIPEKFYTPDQGGYHTAYIGEIKHAYKNRTSIFDASITVELKH